MKDFKGKFVKTEVALEDCQACLKDVNHEKKEAVKNYLAQYLRILLYSEIETQVVELLKKRVSIANDKELASFVIAARKNVLRGLNTSYRDWETDRKSTRLNSSHSAKSRMPSSA